MKFSIEEILKGTNSEIPRAANKTEEGTHERLSEKFCDKEEEGEQTGETNEIEAYSSRAVDGLDENIQRRARTTIAAWQRQELECLFTKYRYPAFEQVEQLSERLGLPQYVIKVWFQNRRAKYRKESRRRNNSLALVAARHLSTLQRVPIPLRIPPERSPRILTTFAPPKRPGDDANVESSARIRQVQNSTQYISLQQSSYDLSYECYERQFSRKNHSQRCSLEPTLEYSQQEKEYRKRMALFMGESERQPNEKCYCRGCEQH